MTVIIAEKPSLARNIAGAIGGLTKRSGYFEGKNVAVTWAFGHLFQLCDVEDYTGRTDTKWTMEGLPCFPAAFRYRLKKDKSGQTDAGAKRQFELIKSLITRADVDAVVNAGDADREGEIIVRRCVEESGVTGKRILRLWLPDQTDETIRAALRNMPDDAEYDNLADEGFARTYIDWLYGVNLTRYCTLKTGSLLRVGRVIVPIVKAIYDRDLQIERFVPEKYLALVSNAETDGVAVNLTSKYKFRPENPARAEKAAALMNEAGAVVTDKKTKKETLNPGKLYSLSKLQNFLGKKYKMPMDDSLSIVQKLYEAGYLTYPRTNSEYLATAEKDKIKKILEGVKGLGYPVVFKDKKTIFDDAKIESHSALTPTFKLPKPDALSDREKLVYSAVLRRFVMVFCAEECVAQKTELRLKVGTYEDFTVKGTVIVQPGWTKFDDTDRSDKLLPNVKVGDKVNVDFHPKEKETAPPKHYTIETLNNYLKNPFRDEKKAAETTDDMEEYRAIFEGLELGTEATRTGIIDNAIKSKYIELKKDVYHILPGGRHLIESLSAMRISMDKYKTSSLGKALKSVYRGEMTVDEAVKLAEDEITEAFACSVSDRASPDYTGFFGETVGVCPVCGREVRRGRYRFECEGRETGCAVSIPTVLCGRPISVNEAKALLTDGKTGTLTGFTSKAGKEFAAALRLTDGKTAFMFL